MSNPEPWVSLGDGIHVERAHARACVLGCQGIKNPGAIGECLRVLRAVACATAADWSVDSRHKAVAAARAALAKLETP